MADGISDRNLERIAHLTEFNDIEATFARLILTNERLWRIQEPSKIDLPKASLDSHLAKKPSQLLPLLRGARFRHERSIIGAY